MTKRKLPRWVAIAIWATGFVLVLLGEAIALGSGVEGDTISEVARWLLGVGEGMAWYYILTRIGLFGLLAWLILHFSGRDV